MSLISCSSFSQCSMYLCTFTLAVSGGAVLLLPFSIISNEILLSLPKNYYIQWLNGSLIHGQYYPLSSCFHMWFDVNLWSNLSLYSCSLRISTGSMPILLYVLIQTKGYVFPKTSWFSIFLVMATRWCQCLYFVQLGF